MNDVEMDSYEIFLFFSEEPPNAKSNLIKFCLIQKDEVLQAVMIDDALVENAGSTIKDDLINFIHL